MAGNDVSIDIALLHRVMALAVSAGEIILPFYRAVGQLQVERKIDQSPVTEADRAADRLLSSQLSELLHLPVLSEESHVPPYAVRSTWSRYWLVDPLDGTREFLSGRGEFTVNIALIDNGRPILGVVYVPVVGVGYAALKGSGAYRYEEGQYQSIRARVMSEREASGGPLAVVISRRYGEERVRRLREELLQAFSHVTVEQVGSSLKQCRIAEGSADLCLHLWPTSEWDTAAGQAIVEAAGGVLVNTYFEPLRYNNKASILNPSFYVVADRDFAWRTLLAACQKLLAPEAQNLE